MSNGTARSLFHHGNDAPEHEKERDMPKPLALCIEKVDAPPETPAYVCCVAVSGREPGLRLDLAGEVVWQRDDAVACELWVSADECLILYRPDGAPPVAMYRAGRRLDVPCGKLVVVLDQDEIQIGPRRLRLYVHGEAPAVVAPAVVAPEPGAVGRLARAAVAAVALAAAAGGCLDTRWPIEVRKNPPKMPGKAEPTPKPPAQKPPPEATAPQGDAPPIEVRNSPPRVAPPSDPR
jgi:hypothetical protein